MRRRRKKRGSKGKFREFTCNIFRRGGGFTPTSLFWIVHILYTDHSSAAGEFFWRYIPFKCAGDVFSTYSVYSAGVFFCMVYTLDTAPQAKIFFMVYRPPAEFSIFTAIPEFILCILICQKMTSYYGGGGVGQR